MVRSCTRKEMHGIQRTKKGFFFFVYQIKWKYKACPRIVVSINKEHLSFIHDVADANNKFTINKVFCN